VSQTVNSRVNADFFKNSFANLFGSHRLFDDTRAQNLVATENGEEKKKKKKKVQSKEFRAVSSSVEAQRPQMEKPEREREREREKEGEDLP